MHSKSYKHSKNTATIKCIQSKVNTCFCLPIDVIFYRNILIFSMYIHIFKTIFILDKTGLWYIHNSYYTTHAQVQNEQLKKKK